MGNKLDKENSFVAFYLFGDRNIPLGNRNRAAMAQCNRARGGVYDLDAYHAVFQETVVEIF